MRNIYVKPAVAADGTIALVRDPMTGEPLAAAGDYKPRSQFWLRRLRDGDVIEAEPPVAGKDTAALPPVSPVG